MPTETRNRERYPAKMAAEAGRWLRQLARRLRPTRRERSLRLRETLSLGQNRFLAVVEVERQKFLVGGAGNSIVLLAQLNSPPRNEPGRVLAEPMVH